VKAALSAWDKANPAPRATIADTADHIDHIRKVAGIDHIGIGGDYDGITTVPGRPRGRLDLSRADRRAPPPRLFGRRCEEDPGIERPAGHARGREGVGADAEGARPVDDARSDFMAARPRTAVSIRGVRRSGVIRRRPGRRGGSRRSRRRRTGRGTSPASTRTGSQERPGWEVLNRGVNRETSAQIRRALRPRRPRGRARAVVIIAGVNDIYAGQPAGEVIEQLRWMYERAREHGIRVVAGSIIPYNTATPDQNARMREVNDWIRGVAAAARTSSSWTPVPPRRPRTIPTACASPPMSCTPRPRAIAAWRRP
jgi:hypothetical protein